MKIDFRKISDAALLNILETYVTSEGTDYGEQTYTLQEKVQQVKAQLESGQAVIEYDESLEALNVVPSETM